jgi:hypothetical protein
VDEDRGEATEANEPITVPSNFSDLQSEFNSLYSEYKALCQESAEEINSVT